MPPTVQTDASRSDTARRKSPLSFILFIPFVNNYGRYFAAVIHCNILYSVFTTKKRFYVNKFFIHRVLLCNLLKFDTFSIFSFDSTNYEILKLFSAFCFIMVLITYISKSYITFHFLIFANSYQHFQHGFQQYSSVEKCRTTVLFGPNCKKEALGI